MSAVYAPLASDVEFPPIEPQAGNMQGRKVKKLNSQQLAELYHFATHRMGDFPGIMMAMGALCIVIGIINLKYAPPVVSGGFMTLGSIICVVSLVDLCCFEVKQQRAIRKIKNIHNFEAVVRFAERQPAQSRTIEEWSKMYSDYLNS